MATTITLTYKNGQCPFVCGGLVESPVVDDVRTHEFEGIGIVQSIEGNWSDGPRSGEIDVVVELFEPIRNVPSLRRLE